MVDLANAPFPVLQGAIFHHFVNGSIINPILSGKALLHYKTAGEFKEELGQQYTGVYITRIAFQTHWDTFWSDILFRRLLEGISLHLSDLIIGLEQVYQYAEGFDCRIPVYPQNIPITIEHQDISRMPPVWRVERKKEREETLEEFQEVLLKHPQNIATLYLYYDYIPRFSNIGSSS